MRYSFLGFALIALISLVFGCGGGVGESTPGPTAATVVIKTVGAPATLYGVEFTAQLPIGVTLTTQGSGQLAAGVMVPSGGATGATVVTNYQSASSPKTVAVSVTKGEDGFPVGEFLTVNAMVAPGAALLPADIALSEFKVFDNLGALAGSITGTVTVP